MTVKDLRAALKGVPGHLRVFGSVSQWSENDYEPVEGAQVGDVSLLTDQDGNDVEAPKGEVVSWATP